MAASAQSNDNYLCIVDQVTGFHHDVKDDNWQHTSFLPGERFLVSSIGADTYKIEKLDEYGAWAAGCRNRLDQTEDSFSCETSTNAVHFNRKELRFTAFRYFGFWNGSRDSLSMAIGQCAPT